MKNNNDEMCAMDGMRAEKGTDLFYSYFPICYLITRLFNPLNPDLP